jgi:hypothetical protein
MRPASGTQRLSERRAAFLTMERRRSVVRY